MRRWHSPTLRFNLPSRVTTLPASQRRTTATGPDLPMCCSTCCPGSPAWSGRAWSSTSGAGPAFRRAPGPTAPKRLSESSRTRRCASAALGATQAANVRYAGGSSYETGLPDSCADVVTCAQSLQWMEPEPTFAEIARILRRGGVFCAYEYYGLLTGSWEPKRRSQRPWPPRAEFGPSVGWSSTADASRRRPSGSSRAVSFAAFASCRSTASSEETASGSSASHSRSEQCGGLSTRECPRRNWGSTVSATIASKLPEGPWLWEYRAWLGLR